MTWPVMAFLIVLAAAVQTQIPGFHLLAQAKAPILLCLSLYYALCRPAPVMLACAFIAGLLQDLLSPLPIGLSVAEFAVLGVVLSSMRAVLQTDSIVTQVFFGASGGTLCGATTWILLETTGLVVCPWERAVLKVLSTGALGAVCAPLVFRLAGGMDRLVGNVRGDAGVEEEEHAFG